MKLKRKGKIFYILGRIQLFCILLTIAFFLQDRDDLAAYPGVAALFLAIPIFFLLFDEGAAHGMSGDPRIGESIFYEYEPGDDEYYEKEYIDDLNRRRKEQSKKLRKERMEKQRKQQEENREQNQSS